MNPEEAKQILLLYRPGTRDGQEPEMVQALELARRDPELGRWFEQHCAFQTALRAKLQQLPAPAQLKAALLAQQNILRPRPWWRRPAGWAGLGMAAAALVLLWLSLARFWSPPAGRSDGLANFQARMVSTVLREYRMDILSPDMAQVRQFLAQQGVPADYALPPGLARLRLTGGGALRWRSHPVAMVCFNRGDDKMLYLFVLNRTAVKDPPPATPQLARVKTLVAASWTRGDKTYVLAGHEEAGFQQKYL